MKLTIVGSSPAWPNPGGTQSGYLLEGSGRLLLDCGAGVLARLRAAAASGWPEIDAIAITHFHLDHWADLVPWVWATLFGPGGGKPKPELWLHPRGADELAHFAGRLGRDGMFEQAFELREYRDGEPFEAAGFAITPIRLLHYDIETYGFRVEDGSSTLAYSGDSGPSPALATLARGADLFLCEATLRRGEVEDDPRGHLSPEEASAAFAESGATRLLVTHRPCELPLGPGIEQAHDGDEISL
ncbi:MAG: MBL fold metallo-hydrolase [Actinobacteria bacterium]|nr:MBL fold metallo-hydrolase [Actinomycetota bacterium]